MEQKYEDEKEKALDELMRVLNGMGMVDLLDKVVM